MTEHSNPDGPPRVEGEITVDEDGNVMIGAPTATASAKAPPPNAGESEEN